MVIFYLTQNIFLKNRIQFNNTPLLIEQKNYTTKIVNF